MSEQEPGMAALRREWLAARIVLIAGFALAIGYGLYAAYVLRASVLEGRQQAAAQIAAEQAEANRAEATANAGVELCRMALGAAQNFGIVPGFTKLTSAQPQETNVTGRYACDAATDSSKFVLAVDLVCRDLQNSRCVSLYSVTQNGGAVLYQRHD